MSRFEFVTATRIIFGSGTLKEAAPIMAGWGKHIFLVIGVSSDQVIALYQQLEGQETAVTQFKIAKEPTIDLVLTGVQQARAAGCDCVLSIGGGSAIDTGKAIAALLTNAGEPLDYLEVIGQGQPLLNPPAPYGAVPTTAGTGAEVTRNAVLASPKHRIKVSLRSPLMLPRLAIIDPELTYTMPPPVTASTGLDALTQVMEPFVSHLANPLTDAFCREGLKRATRSLYHAFVQGSNVDAREDMALTSLFGGLALANAKLGAVHGFAGPIGGMFPAPHGIICARLLPYVMSANVRALGSRDPANPALARNDEVAQIVTGNRKATAVDGVIWVQELCTELAVPPLSDFGVTPADFPVIVAKSQRASSMKGNPLPLTDAELTEILEAAV